MICGVCKEAINLIDYESTVRIDWLPHKPILHFKCRFSDKGHKYLNDLGLKNKETIFTLRKIEFENKAMGNLMRVTLE